jgi:cytochrome P450
MDIFGPSLLTTAGHTWSRQRKLIAPRINEKISSLVFGESCRQASEMMDVYISQRKGIMTETMRDMKRVAINVLGLVGFGMTTSWSERSPTEKQNKGFRLSYMEATKTVVENIVEAAVLPSKLLLLPLFPTSWQNIAHAKREFPLHTEKMLESEKERQKNSGEPRSNLLSMLVRLMDPEYAAEGSEKGEKGMVLHEDEILGNLFVFVSCTHRLNGTGGFPADSDLDLRRV